MIAAITDAVDAAGRDEAVRVILFTAEGDHFCSGFDIVGRNAGAEADAPGRPRIGSIQRRLPSGSHRLIPLLTTVQVPVVCAVRGWAAGIGAARRGRVGLCDRGRRRQVVGAVHGARVHARQRRHLVVAEVDRCRAGADMLLLGRTVTGMEAAEWGLVHQAVPERELDAAVDAIVQQLASGPTVALGLTKWMLAAGASSSLDEHLRNEAFALELSSRSQDFREGLAAFVEKRPPRFEGR